MQFSFLVFAVCCSLTYTRPIAYKSFEAFDAVSTVTTDSFTMTAFVTTPSFNAASTSRSSLPADFVQEWMRTGLNVLISIISSGGFVCSCWCSLKYLRNGCACKSAWFYPKSKSEYARRREIKEDQKMVEMATVEHQPTTMSPLSSSFSN